MACGEAIRTLPVCCSEQNCFSDRGRISNLYFKNIYDMSIINISGHKSDGSDDYESLISLKMSKNDYLFVEAPPKTSCLLTRLRKRTVCWGSPENEPFVDATPKTNCLLYGGIVLTSGKWTTKVIVAHFSLVTIELSVLKRIFSASFLSVLVGVI